jgi:hypothetical protein
LFTIPAIIGCSTPTIERTEVERIISTLASDDMRGRATFSPGIDRAADFLAGEFESIGLDPLPREAGIRPA